jgi:hypothetical protein
VACSGPAPPKANSAKSRGSWPARYRNHADRAGHLDVAEAQHSARGFDARQAGGRADLLLENRADMVDGYGIVDGEQLLRIESPEHQVGVRNGRLGPAAAVADRAGIGAGAFWSDLDQAGSVDPGDRATAGAHRVDRDHRHVDRHGVFDLGLVGDRRFGVPDQRDVGGGAAHVVSDEVFVAGAFAGIGSGDDAGGRAGHHGLGRFLRDEAGGDHAAIAVHDQEVAGVAARLQLAPQPFDIALQDRLYRRVDGCCYASLEFARFRKQRMAGGDVTVRPEFGCDLRRPPLVRGIGVGMQKMDDEGFAAGFEQRRDGSSHLAFIELNAHRARRLYPLGNLQPEIARDDRHERTCHAIGLRPGAAAELDHVAEAARSDHASLSEPAFQYGIGGGGRAVHDEVDLLDRESGFGQRSHNAESLVVDSGRRLGDMDLAAIAPVDQQKVGEGAADIDAGDDIARVCRKILSHAPNPKCPD